MGIGVRRTIGSIVDEATATLSAVGLDEPRRRARRLVAAVLGLPPAEIFAYPERLVGAAAAIRGAEMLARLAKHEPLSRILGHREFWGLEFRLSADTLDPRPETETVVEAALARLAGRTRPWRLLDLGTGSGCILLALLSELPQAEGIGIDIAAGAAATARTNAARLGLSGRAAFAVGDWGRPFAARFDVVIANPPYIASPEIAALPREVAAHDPRRALDGGPDGLAAHRVIAGQLPRLLRPGGFFAAEIGIGQEPAISRMLRQVGLAVEAPLPDLAGIPRCVVAWR
ncbi:MAG TPA: peptide chain release factor N(5)-glutamine methyltransferase [Stellaceae bacterium]|nr:peptide chain release factor N(5)-glutamine methyltransferase [Stellaceae bacterium]